MNKRALNKLIWHSYHWLGVTNEGEEADIADTLEIRPQKKQLFVILLLQSSIIDFNIHNIILCNFITQKSVQHELLD